MGKFNLGQDVQIVATGREGKVIGIWESIESPTQYNVRYYDSTDRAADFWFYTSDLKSVQ